MFTHFQLRAWREPRARTRSGQKHEQFRSSLTWSSLCARPKRSLPPHCSHVGRCTLGSAAEKSERRRSRSHGDAERALFTICKIGSWQPWEVWYTSANRRIQLPVGVDLTDNRVVSSCVGAVAGAGRGRGADGRAMAGTGKLLSWWRRRTQEALVREPQSMSCRQMETNRNTGAQNGLSPFHLP